MTLCRMIAPIWATHLKKVLEGEFTDEQIKDYNLKGYSIYYLPNHPGEYDRSTTLDGTHIDVFNWVFVDCDLKDGAYPDKDSFLEAVGSAGVDPSKIIDSGNGIHVYWKVQNLDAMSYLRFQRRLLRLFNTDEAVGQIFQLMRLPGTINTKNKDAYVDCIQLYECDISYTAEELDKLLPPITLSDETYCKQHYDRTYGLNQDQLTISDTLPPKFGKLLRDNKEAKELWTGDTDDRSRSDYRLGHLMFASGFTKDEAASVLVNSAKALQRAPVHRNNYAKNIVDKIWIYEMADDKDKLDLSSSVKDILNRPSDILKGTSIKCHPCVDNTERGYKLGDVIGLVAGSGVGKTAFAMNMFRWFTKNNPDYYHFFVPLEQPANEIADRWKTMCGADSTLHSKVHIMSNYDNEGNFRHLSLDEICDYLTEWQTKTGNKIGCVVIDHIGALKKKGSNDENQDLITICHKMKSFAIKTNTLLIMQSQTSRQKAGIGDQELDKDSAYGTLFFEAYCDYLITLWQPLKRCHSEAACPTVTAYKFCKIRHKKAKRDIIKEDVPYFLYFDSNAETLRELTEDEKVSFDFFLPKATNKRKASKHTELIEYKSAPNKQDDSCLKNQT